MPPGISEQPLRFGRFEISPAERMLRVDGQPAALGARAFDVLLALAQRRDRLVGKQELLDVVWPGVAVEEFALGDLQSAEASLRQSLHLARERGDVRLALVAMHNLVRALVAGRKHEDAHACTMEADLLLRGVREDVLRFDLLEVAGCLASSRGEHEMAARFWGSALQPYAEAGYRNSSQSEALLQRLSALSRRAIGDAAFEQAEAAGRALDSGAALLELGQWLGHRA